MTDAYIASAPRVTPTVATLNRDYFESKIGSIKTVDELTSDARLLNYIKVAFDLNDVTIVTATIENILTSDLSDPNNYIATFGKNDKRYIAMRNAFNFQADGTLAAGTTPQTTLQTATTTNGYMTHYNDKDDAADANALKLFKSDIRSVTSVKDFLDSSAVYNYALKAVGLDPAKVNVADIRKVLTSDLQDKKSYVYTLKDERYVKLADLFNFKSDGSLGLPFWLSRKSKCRPCRPIISRRSLLSARRRTRKRPRKRRSISPPRCRRSRRSRNSWPMIA